MNCDCAEIDDTFHTSVHCGFQNIPSAFAINAHTLIQRSSHGCAVKDQLTSSHGLSNGMWIPDVPLYQLDIGSAYPCRFAPVVHQNTDSGLFLHRKAFS